jgi:hypothetical protein
MNLIPASPKTCFLLDQPKPKFKVEGFGNKDEKNKTFGKIKKKVG